MTLGPVVAAWHPYGCQPQRRTVRSSADAAKLLEELAAGDQGRVLVDFTHPNGGCLTVGSGGTISVLGFQEGLDPPYHASRGDGAETTQDFAYGGLYTDFPLNAYVSTELASAAVREFVESGRRPACVHWQEV